MTVIDVAALACGYLLGSVPVGWLLVRLTTREDLTRTGSTNVGALNAMRVARSRWVGVAVLVLDALKGAAAVGLAKGLGAEPCAGLVGVVAGHCYNLWLSLRARRLAGGKGFSAAAGAVLLLYPWLDLLWLGIGLVAWVALRFGRGIRDEAPASAIATFSMVPCALWLHGDRAATALAVTAALILPKLAREVWGLLRAPR